VVTVVAVIAAAMAAAKTVAIAAVTNASHAGKATGVKGQGERVREVGKLVSCLSLYPFPFTRFYLRAAGVILSVIRSPARISSTSYSCPAFISPRA